MTVSILDRAAQNPASIAPRVSIGMPAYNAEATIAEALDALLSQTWSDFELIVSDNASADRTWQIVQDYARRDSRIVPMRQACNIGANGNYSTVFRAARGRYFKWASSNDWCAPTFLERCVRQLDADPEAVLVAPRTRLFEQSVDIYREYADDIPFDGADPVARFLHVGESLKLNNVLNGVVRSEALAKTRLIDHFPGADNVLVGHLALLGKLVLLDEPLFYRRMDRATATHLMSREAVHRHHYPAATLRSLFPAWRFVAGLGHAVLASRLGAGDKARALRFVAREMYWRRASLKRDLFHALRVLTRR